MLKLVAPNKKRKEISLLVTISVLVLALLTISPMTSNVGKLELFSSSNLRYVPEHLSSGYMDEAENSMVASYSLESYKSLQEREFHTELAYLGTGFGAAIFVFFIYLYMNYRKPENSKNSTKFYPQSKSRLLWNKSRKDKFRVRKIRIFTAVPILCITIAELLIFSGNVGAAVWLHIGTLMALSLSGMFIKDSEIHKIYQALMLLPVLRLINLSMPIFFENTLYTFIFVYGPLAIPVGVIVIHQEHSLEKLGISMKNIIPYMILSVPLGFLLGLGEYMTIESGYLIPNLDFQNLLYLTIIMVFFVGLVEEVIFRTILQTRLEEALSIQEALLITSLMFGLMHSGYGTFYEILYTGFVGFIMGLIFYKTRSLPFIAVLHGFVNVFLFGILPHCFGG